MKGEEGMPGCEGEELAGAPGRLPRDESKGGSWGTSEGAGLQGSGADREAGGRPAAQSEPGRAWEPTRPAQRLGGSQACTRHSLGAKA